MKCDDHARMRPPCYKMPTHLQRTRPSDCDYNKQWQIPDVCCEMFAYIV